MRRFSGLLREPSLAFYEKALLEKTFWPFSENLLTFFSSATRRLFSDLLWEHLLLVIYEKIFCCKIFFWPSMTNFLPFYVKIFCTSSKISSAFLGGDLCPVSDDKTFWSFIRNLLLVFEWKPHTMRRPSSCLFLPSIRRHCHGIELKYLLLVLSDSSVRRSCDIL